MSMSYPTAAFMNAARRPDGGKRMSMKKRLGMKTRGRRGTLRL